MVAKKSNSKIDLPEDFWLLPDERLLPKKTFRHEKRNFEKTPSSIEQLLRLTSATSTRKIGINGPSLASLAFEPSKKSKRPNLRTMLKPLLSGTGPINTTPEHLRLYEAVFGRDSLRVAIDLISSYPQLARATTLRLATLQGVEYNTEREEEPGRIIHEAREQDDERAIMLSKEFGWGWPYYGSVDATPEFVRTLSAYCRRTEENIAFLSHPQYTDRAGKKRSMAYALDMAIEWICMRLDSNPEGILEYKTVLPQGIDNQVWKDSWDSYHHADGTIANHDQGISSIEVQVTTYDALLDAAELYEDVYDEPGHAETLRRRAETLKRAIIENYWTEDKGGYFVLGTDRDADGNVRQLKIRTSNMGHVLNSRLLLGDNLEETRMRDAVVRQILSPSMLNISGIRTLANDEVRFRPGSYHNGSVWLWDTHHIAKGLRRHGLTTAADELDRRLLHIVETTKIFPEYVRGDNNLVPGINEWTITVYDEKQQRENVVEQPPQEVQAWTVAAILAIKKRLNQRQALANMSLDQLSNRIQKIARLPRVFGK